MKKFGMPTLLECDDLEACVGVATRLELDFVEINMSFPQYQSASSDLTRAMDLSARSGVFYTIHADEQLNPFDFNARVSRCYRDVMADTVHTALRLQVPVINMHLLRGIYVTLPDRVILLSDMYRKQYRESIRDFVKMCEDLIGDAPLRIAIENVDTNPFTASQREALADFFMQSPVFGMTLDSGHEDCLGGQDTPIFHKYADRVLHMHLHDSDGRHPHLPLGAGHIPVADTLGRLRGQTCLIEVKTVEGLQESVSYLRRNGLWKTDENRKDRI